jgi:Zn-finger nucleic acid-binding protein/ribosomal protein L40E
VRRIPCPRCQIEYDVTRLARREFPCSCGATVHNVVLKGVDARILRCASCGAAVAPDAGTCEFCRSPIERDAGALSSICPRCYARNPERSGFCVACGLQFDREPSPVKPGGAACPSCPGALARRAIGEIPVDECPRCNGLWVSSERFNTLVNRVVEAQRARPGNALGLSEKRRRAKPAFSAKVAYRRCPDCGGIMQRRNFAKRSGVIVDVCGKHGVWLDADELEALAAFVEEGGLAAASLVAGELDAGFGPVDEKVLEARIEAEKLLARERVASNRRLRNLTEGPSGGLVDTLGDLFRKFLES